MISLVSKSKRFIEEAFREVVNLAFSTTHKHLPRVLANSMPKAGTNLLIRLLRSLGFKRQGFLEIGPNEGLRHVSNEQLQRANTFLARLKPGLFSVSHFYAFPELMHLIGEMDIKFLTIVRDPRDVCVSDVYHIMRTSSHRLHPYYSKQSLQQGLMASIVGMGSSELDGAPPSLDIGSHYRNYLGWSKEEMGLMVKFEDLIGQRGGGDDRVQRETVSRITDYLGLQLSSRKLAEVCDGLFWSRAATFRKGQVGSWRDHFTPDHLAAFERVCGKIMVQFGYPGPQIS